MKAAGWCSLSVHCEPQQPSGFITSDFSLAPRLIAQSGRNPDVFCQESVINASFIETEIINTQRG